MSHIKPGQAIHATQHNRWLMFLHLSGHHEAAVFLCSNSQDERAAVTKQTLTLRSVYESTAIVPVAKVISLLEKEVSLDRVADFSAKIEAARKYDSENTERRNYWGELAIWSSRRLGELIRVGQKAKVLATRGQPKKEKLHGATILADIGIEKTQSHRAQRLAAIPAEKITEYVAKAKADGEEVSKAGVVKFANGKGGSAVHVSQNTGCPEWYTPSEFIESARTVMGSIDLDPAI